MPVVMHQQSEIAWRPGVVATSSCIGFAAHTTGLDVGEVQEKRRKPARALWSWNDMA